MAVLAINSGPGVAGFKFLDDILVRVMAGYATQGLVFGLKNFFELLVMPDEAAAAGFDKMVLPRREKGAVKNHY